MITSSNDVTVGSELASTNKISYQRSLVEKKFLPDSIHNNDYTRSKGYAGALTSSYVLCGYMSELMVNSFGSSYLKGGKISIRFINGGVQNGDKITCKGVIKEKIKEKTGVRVVCDIWMEKSEGVKVVAGNASVVLPD